MERIEFIDQLRRSLSGSLGSSSVNENIRYYQEYIESQVRTGESEEEVIARLGNPRLLAKSIIEASRNESTYHDVQTEDTEIYEDGSHATEKRGTGGKLFHMPVWLVLILAVVILFVVLGAVTSIITASLPVLLPLLLVFWVFRLLRRK